MTVILKMFNNNSSTRSTDLQVTSAYEILRQISQILNFLNALKTWK